MVAVIGWVRVELAGVGAAEVHALSTRVELLERVVGAGLFSSLTICEHLF
jgi:hypothetical protein